MKYYNKPNYINEKFLEATDKGWVDNRTGEILVAVPHLINRLKSIGYDFGKNVQNEVKTEEAELKEINRESEELINEQESDLEIEKIVNEEVPDLQEQTPAPAKKRRGRPAKNKEI